MMLYIYIYISCTNQCIKSLVGTQNWTHVELEVFPDITDLEDDGGTSVVIFANPPLNYTAVVEGCWFKTHQRITIILVDGVWRHGRGRRPMKPYSKYNITVYSGTKPVAFKQFITDVGSTYNLLLCSSFNIQYTYGDRLPAEI